LGRRLSNQLELIRKVREDYHFAFPTGKKEVLGRFKVGLAKFLGLALLWWEVDLTS